MNRGVKEKDTLRNERSRDERMNGYGVEGLRDKGSGDGREREGGL